MASKEALLALQLSCRGDAARESTLRDWVKFVEDRKQSHLLQQLPQTPSGAAIDWLKLYEEVVARGGFRVVSQRRQWADLVGPHGLNIKGMMPYQVAAHYDRFLRAFEEKQLFGRDGFATMEMTTSTSALKRRATKEMDDEDAPIATMQDLEDAEGGMGGTPLPRANKRFRAQRELQTHLGTLHNIVLALDSGLPEQVMGALNLLTVLSYGDDSGGGSYPPATATATINNNATACENELLVDNVPGLLDALYRQLAECKLLPDETEITQEIATRIKLLNLAVEDGERELLDSKALLVLNIVRNLAIIGANEKPMAAHDELCVFLILALRYVNNPEHRYTGRARVAVRIGDHVLDTLCAISKRMDFLALHPPASLEIWYPEYHLSSHLWRRERVAPLECLLREVRRILVDRELNVQRRSVVLRVCELLTNVCRDVSLKSSLASSHALQDPVLLDRIVSLMSCCRHDFLWRRDKQQQHALPQDPDRTRLETLDADVSDDEEDDDTDGDDTSRWPAPWENDGLPSGVGMGVVYVSPEGVRHTSTAAAVATAVDDDASQLDHEMRDAALEVLVRFSDYDDAMKLRIAQHPTCMRRLAGTLLSCIGRPEAARMTVATLCNISMLRATFPYFLPIEKDLILVACSDVSVSDILNNVVADVYGMHSL
ncbi:hypothetical protein PsorP6_012701 [Peronosclerospora sorghi]|uniref:Uncharacterized protein n=1 Tax=Peronosclerospora sorghi TaxID=230839 RepID=A0ACC0WJ60_9STRA|nr:hypothetical protein PsorP6_012701 [Peronosclerospora sorghi]